MNRRVSAMVITGVTVLLATVITAQTTDSPKKAPPPVLPAGIGRDLVSKECSRCHVQALADVVRHRETEAAWKKSVDDMVVRGAKLTPVEATQVVQYLFKNYGPPPPPPAATPLAEGEGRDVLLEKCTVCHDLERVPARYRDKLGWEDLVDNMKSRGADVTPEERQKIVDYLFAHYGIP